MTSNEKGATPHTCTILHVSVSNNGFYYNTPVKLSCASMNNRSLGWFTIVENESVKSEVHFFSYSVRLDIESYNL